MILRAVAVVLVIAIAGTFAPAQSATVSAKQTTVCDIVNHPSDFIGNTVEVRAQIWTDTRDPYFFWMNESSSQFGKVCRFLKSSFLVGTDLAGQTAFGTFRGRIVKRLDRQKLTPLDADPKGPSVIFLVDQQSDIYLRRDYLNGPIPILQLYDPQTASFVRPED